MQAEGKSAQEILDALQTMEVKGQIRVSEATEEMIDQKLFQLGFPTCHKGYFYLKEAIKLYLRAPDSRITRDVYPLVARKYNVEVVAVEMGIRRIIDDAKLKNTYEFARVFANVQKMTNGNVIKALSAELKN